MDLHLREAEVSWHRHWLPRDAADTLQRTLREDVPWEVHRIRMFGRQVDSPRLSCWMGDPAARYRYSGTEFVPQPWHPALLPLRDQLAAFCGHAFNSVLLNRYRDGDDGMGWHSDNEPELGPAPVIASLSLGAGRRFLLRRRDDHAKGRGPAGPWRSAGDGGRPSAITSIPAQKRATAGRAPQSHVPLDQRTRAGVTALRA